MGAKGGILSGIKNVTDELSDIVKKSTDTGMREFATPTKTVGPQGKKRVVIDPSQKTIVTTKEDVLEKLNPSLKRAIESEEASSIMPVPSRLINPDKKGFSSGVSGMINRLTNYPPDIDYGEYIDLTKQKIATGAVYRNAYIGTTTSAKKTEGSNKVTFRAIPESDSIDESKLTIAKMKENFKNKTGENGKQVNANLLQPERFSVLLDGKETRLNNPIVSVHYNESGGKHYYSLHSQFVGPVVMNKQAQATPNLKPATIGSIENGLGNQVGTIRIYKGATKKSPSKYTDHPLYDYIEVDGTAASSPDAPMSLESKFNEGGVTKLVRSLPPTVRQQTNMFGGTTVLDDPVLDHHFKNIKQGKTQKNKDGYLNTVVTIQVEDKNLNDGKPTLIPTVYDGKIISEKEAIKKAIDSGEKWTSADTHAELREYDIMLHKRMSGDLAFNKGGAVPMQRQMEMFNDGGLKEEGGTKDPVSGNDVPSGSLQEEVRDDIDAKLSPGEFVFPADVVRFIGLEKLMLMRDKAKKGLARMEEMGQMGNSEEATIDDDVPFGMEDLIIVAGPPDNEMNKGGMPTYSNGGAGRFQQIVGQPMFESTTKLFKDDKNNVLYIPFVRGQPVYEPPPGYREVSETEQKQEAETTNVESARVAPVSEAGSGELGGGPDKGDKSFGEMSPTEKAAFGKDLQDPIKGPMIRGTIGALTTAGNIALGPNPVVEAIANKFGVPSFDLAKGVQEMYGKAIGFANMTPAELEAAAQSYNDKVSKANEKSVTTISTDPAVQATTLSRAYGASPTQIASHIDNISRGNAPPGTSANAFGGFSTSGPGGFSTNAEGDTIGGAAGAQIQKARELDIDIREVLANRPDELANLSYGSRSPTLDAQISVDMYGFDSDIGKSQRGSPGTPGPDVSGANTPGGGPTSASDVSGGFGGGVDAPGSGVGGAPSSPGAQAAADMADTEAEAAGQEAAAGAEAAGAFKGGFIPKRKKQKKMKRGGLASR